MSNVAVKFPINQHLIIMDAEKLKIANSLQEIIKELEDDFTHCKIMSDNMHNHLTIRSTSMSFHLPPSQAKTILIIAKNAIEEELEKAREEFISL